MGRSASPRRPHVRHFARDRRRALAFAGGVNLVLFDVDELASPLPLSDRRAQHIVRVLRRAEGDTFDAGIINGARGRGTVTQITADTLSFAFDPVVAPSSIAPIHLLVGLPRPQTGRDILRDATTLGVERIDFVATDKGEPSYAQSSLWSSGEWRRQAIVGAEQAFDTHLPTITYGQELQATIDGLSSTGCRIALDNYEAPTVLSQCLAAAAPPVTLAIGAERGWSADERRRLREAGFQFAHLGTRVLRTETAVIAALTLVRARLGEL